MTKALKELLEKVEAGDWGVEASRAARTASPGMNDTMWSAYCGSLDAAKALHEALLPKWGRSMVSDGNAYVCAGGKVYTAEVEDNPARAWLIAILKAKIAENEKVLEDE